jgi:hypothetical protein
VDEIEEREEEDPHEVDHVPVQANEVHRRVVVA